ncbi:MAG: DUF2157 domain-containing protein [Cytophagaceae bacterium]|nr:DUF2157 domain-containing protein [Cytophagaceae bacterium]
MEKIILSKLRKENLLPEPESKKTEYYHAHKLFSLHWEIKTILYLGVLLLSTGVGLIIYENIDSISHQAILAAIGLACAACFYYCFKNAKPYQHTFVESPGLIFDYVLLLACLLFLSFEGYFQYQYNIFGERYGLAVLIPAILFFYLAYRMDHKGVLSLAITGLAGWMGLAVTPQELLSGATDFSEMTMVWTGLGFGVSVSMLALWLEKEDIKKHFTFTYLNFASHALFFATLAGLFMLDTALKLLFVFFLVSFCTAFIIHARRQKSFYFLLIATLYGYIGMTYLIFQIADEAGGDNSLYMMIFYFMATCAGIILFFSNHKKLLGK